MKISSAALGLTPALVTALLAIGCADPTPEASAHTATATATVAAFDLSSYCHASCDRAARCGLDGLDKAAKGNAAEVALINEARDHLKETTATCEASCAGAAPSEATRPALEEAERCLAQTECEAFAACLERVGSSKP